MAVDTRCAQVEAALTAMTRGSAVGAVTLIRDGARTWEFAAGFGDLATGRPADVGACFRAGSLAKSFVAAAVLQLVGEGLLRLDDVVEAWLPGALPNGSQVTLRQLMNHTSGVADYATALVAGPRRLLGPDRYRMLEPAELAAPLRTAAPVSPPGSAWRYSNSNYLLIGLIAEAATGRCVEDLLAERLLRPLELRTTFAPRGTPFLPSPHLRAYLWGRDGGALDITVQSPAEAWCSGDLISTTQDVGRFFDALLAGSLLPECLQRELTSTVAATPERDYGLGVFRMRLANGEHVWGGSGAFGGYISFALRSEDGERSMTVCATARSGQLAGELIDYAALVFGRQR